jgi:DNA polymerase-1
MDEPARQKHLPGLEPESDSPSPAGATAGLPGSASETGEAPYSLLDKPAVAPESLQGKTVWVIDTHSLLYQVFHALPEMTSPLGEPVGAVYGFIRDLLYLLEAKRPDYLFCALDLPGGTFRHELYDQYKIHRTAMPEDLVPQVAAVRRVLETMGIPGVGLERFEADDVMATLARLTDELGGECYIVTSDKDCRQLITDRVRLYNIRKDQIMDREDLLADWGIAPEQVVDFQALVGDSVDNVPGVPLIGPKLAKELIEKYGTLEAVLDHADEVSGKKRKQNLIEGRDQAMLSRKLVRLDDHVPAPIDWSAGRVGPLDRDRMSELFTEFGFRSLLGKLDAVAAGPGREPPKMKVRYHLVDTPELFEAFLVQFRRQKCVSLDTETTNIRPRWAEIVGYSFAWQDDEAWYLPVRAPEGEACLDPKTTLEALRGVLEDTGVEKVGQNLKYDMIVLRSAGVHLAGLAFDTMVASYLLDAGARNHNLDELAMRYLGHETIKISELIGSGKNQKRMDEVSTARVAEYAGEDALMPWLLRPILARKLAEAKLDELFTRLELPLIDVLVELEYNGITVNCERLAELSRGYGERIADLEDEIHEMAGRLFNIASPKQLQQVLFTEQKLPVVKKTKTGPSTDADALSQLAVLHPLPAKIIEYRQFAKLKGTYVDALPRMIHPVTGRVHASFNQGVTATGRLSSSDPNLQNIPVRGEVGREIRSAFVPEPADWLLMAADYSQIELRVLAHLSGDQRLCEAFDRDEDIHARVASQVNHVPLDEVTPEMRREAKAVNFGVIYGQSPFGLAKQLGINQEEAARFIDAYFEGYPGIEEFLSRILAECHQRGYVSTILGRRRMVRGVRPDAPRQRNLTERTAINTVIQGSAADLIKQALAELVTEEMVGAHALDVPLKVDLKAGPNWAEAKTF